MRYGDLLSERGLGPSPLPQARGPLTAWLFDVLRATPGRPVRVAPTAEDDPLYGDDSALALYCLYELHYRGFAGLDEGWEWDPALLAARAYLERAFEARLRAEIPDTGHVQIPRRLYEIADQPDGPSVSAYLAEEGSVEQFREFVVHRSAYQLKEADPHSWGLPRLAGAAKAALVEIQAEEYGAGQARDMHQNLFGLTMDALDLDTTYHAYLDRLPGVTLAATNLASYFGLHRRHRGALIGHLAMFEMTSVEPMGRYSAALRRLGYGADARHYFDVHVVADAHHRSVAAEDLAVAAVRQEPGLARDMVFGALAVYAVEAALTHHLLGCWATGNPSLLPARATSGPVRRPTGATTIRARRIGPGARHPTR